MAINSQQFNNRSKLAPRKVNKVEVTSKLEKQISNLTFVVQWIVVRNIKQQRVYGVYYMVGNSSYICLSLSEISLELTNALGGFQEKKKFYKDKNRILSDTIQERIEQKNSNFSIIVPTTSFTTIIILLNPTIRLGWNFTQSFLTYY